MCYYLNVHFQCQRVNATEGDFHVAITRRSRGEDDIPYSDWAALWTIRISTSGKTSYFFPPSPEHPDRL